MCCKSNCLCLAVIVAILAGVALGILYAMGLVATGIIVWVYLLTGIAGILLSPLYASAQSCAGRCHCFARYRAALLAGAVGAIVAAALGLILAPVATVVTVAIVLGVATFFAVLLLIAIVCLTNCLTKE